VRVAATHLVTRRLAFDVAGDEVARLAIDDADDPDEAPLYEFVDGVEATTAFGFGDFHQPIMADARYRDVAGSFPLRDVAGGAR